MSEKTLTGRLENEVLPFPLERPIFVSNHELDPWITYKENPHDQDCKGHLLKESFKIRVT